MPRFSDMQLSVDRTLYFALKDLTRWRKNSCSGGNTTKTTNAGSKTAGKEEKKMHKEALKMFVRPQGLCPSQDVKGKVTSTGYKDLIHRGSQGAAEVRSVSSLETSELHHCFSQMMWVGWLHQNVTFSTH